VSFSRCFSAFPVSARRSFANAPSSRGMADAEVLEALCLAGELRLDGARGGAKAVALLASFGPGFVLELLDALTDPALGPFEAVGVEQELGHEDRELDLFGPAGVVRVEVDVGSADREDLHVDVLGLPMLRVDALLALRDVLASERTTEEIATVSKPRERSDEEQGATRHATVVAAPDCDAVRTDSESKRKGGDRGLAGATSAGGAIDGRAEHAGAKR